MNFQMSVINLTHRCNLRCPYCFETFNHEEMNRPLDISEETLEKSLNFMYKQNNTRYIVVYGGEPFLRPDLVEYILKYHKKNDIRCGQIMTNATLIDDNIAKMLFKYRKNFSTIVCSIDSISNSVKCLDNVRGNLDVLNKYGLNYSIQATITSDTLPYAYDSIMEFLKLDRLSSGINMRYICGDKQFKSKEDIDEYEKICKKIFIDSNHDKRISYYKRITPIKLFMKVDLPVYCSEYMEYGEPSLNIDTDGKCYFCEHYGEAQKQPIGDIDNGIDYELLNLPDNLECSPTRCFYFDCHNEYFNKSIENFKNFVYDDMKKDCTLNLEGTTDSLYQLAIEVYNSLKKYNFINIKLTIEKDVFIPKLKDFLETIERYNNIPYINIELEVIDNAGIL